jgi:hypothetical protein
MVQGSLFASCAVDRGFDQRSDQTKDNTIYIGTWRKRIKAKLSVLFLWNRYTHFCIYAKQKMHYVQINNMVIDI